MGRTSARAFKRTKGGDEDEKREEYRVKKRRKATGGGGKGTSWRSKERQKECVWGEEGQDALVT